MISKVKYAIALMSLFTSSLFGGYEVRTVKIPELHNQIIQANYFTTLNYDFSELVDSFQVISRLVISISGDFTPGFGDMYGSGNYAPLDGSQIMIEPFDNHIMLGGYFYFSDENTVFSLELDSHDMIGTNLPGIWDGPYPGYSGNIWGNIDFYFGQGRTLSTVVESWPVIEINEATYTLYLVPEPTSLLLLGLGGLFLRWKAGVRRC